MVHSSGHSVIIRAYYKAHCSLTTFSFLKISSPSFVVYLESSFHSSLRRGISVTYSWNPYISAPCSPWQVTDAWLGKDLLGYIPFLSLVIDVIPMSDASLIFLPL